MSLSLSSALALGLAMALLAALPSVSVLAVVARAASAGWRQGAWLALGVVLGDIIFILLAIFGWVLLLESLGDAARWLYGLAALWLVLLASRLWRAQAPSSTQAQPLAVSSWSSLLTGLAITLADQKAVLFYLGFLPAFVDLAALTARDVLAVILITTISVGGVKLIYALLAQRASLLLGERGSHHLYRLAALLMLLAAMALVWRAL